MKKYYLLTSLTLLVYCANPPKDKPFHHKDTFFPLTGAHVGVTCRDCHKEGMNRRIPNTCVSCHPMSLTHTQNQGDCDVCHRTATFSPAIFNHLRLGVKIAGAHYGLDCAQCHKLPVYTGIAWTCSNCHKPPMLDSRVHITNKDQCENCHGQVSFNPSLFKEHNTFSTSLIGAHFDLTCSACHTQRFTNWLAINYRDGTVNGFCSNCHTRNYRPGHEGHRTIQQDANCRQCHNFSSFGD